ncbi:MAG: tripartite tricarboxylate transporter substrate binding protein [Betaproteobacteria bacterium]|nr:tripartite tricarboxylate transporter substrate binding protein [Betaproteobacteria bacterium]
MKSGIIAIAALVASAVPALVSSSAPAQTYPGRPIRLIVPFPPGGGTDATARVLTQALADGPGWQVVVENRPGATGRIGTALAAKAAPDGYTLLLGTAGPNAILPAAYSKLPYDAVKDFAPVSLIDSAAYALVVHPSLPVRHVKDLIALARSKPGQITFASAGNLSVGHMAAEFFKQFAKVDMTHVAYKGGGPAVIATMSGETAVYFGGPSVVHQAKAGKLRAIATTGARRSKIFPDLPAIAETLPGYEIAQWVGALAPAATPRDILSSVHATIVKALGTAKVEQQFAAMGSERIVSSPEEFAAHIRSEIAKWRKVLKGSRVPLQ